jgi:signal transduction histidine kinase
VLTVTSEGDEALVQVADNGCGMTPEVQAKIWEPFFTTKGKEGTGLGLDISRKLIVSHGGTITFTSAPGAGTTFEIRLPIAPTA